MKNNILKVLDLENYSTVQLIFIIGIFIFFIPQFFILFVNILGIEAESLGQFGDAFTGVTGPFINGLAAILIFIAFKAQVKANEIFRKQESLKVILGQIKELRDDRSHIKEMISAIESRITWLQHPQKIIMIDLLNTISYLLNEISLTIDLVDKTLVEKEFAWKKLRLLYIVKYKDMMTNLIEQIESMKIHEDYEFHITEILFEYKSINKKFTN